MNLPFETSEFLRTFGRYNEAMWPAPLVLSFLGILGAAMIISRRSAPRRVARLILGALWVWIAVAYHIAFFALINPAALWFALLALTQAAMFFYASFGVLRPPSLRVNTDRVVGGVIIAFGLLIYPALSYLTGHRYPEMPTFGTPCPTTIFTIGVLAAMHEELPWQYTIIPITWAGISTAAALQLGMVEDLGLAASAIALITLMAAHAMRSSRRTHFHAHGAAR